MKAILLVRVSTQHQDLTSQTEKVRAEAIKDGYSTNDIIILEDKESAIKLSEEERNGLNRMKEHIEKGYVDCVYTYEVSRISRQPAMLYNIRDYLIEHHVQLIILNPYMKMLDDEGNLSPTANVFFSIFTGLAENEMYLKNQRIARGFERKRKSLEHAGGQIPYGYTLDKNHHYIINEDEAIIVRRIYEEYADGKSLKYIAKQLQSEGYKANINIHSLVRMMFRMLHKDYYAGDWKHPAIVSKYIYDNVQTRADDNRTYYGENTRTALLKGIMYSVASGHMMGARFKTNQYICNRTRNNSCKMSTADIIVLGVAKEWHNIIHKYRRSEYVKIVKSKIEQCNRIISQQEKNITDNQNTIDRIEERYIYGKISKERADALEKRAFDEMNTYKKLYGQAISDKKRLEEELTNDKINMSDRDIVTDIVEKVYFERHSKSVISFTIINRYTGEERTLTVNAFSGEIKDMKVQTRPTLGLK